VKDTRRETSVPTSLMLYAAAGGAAAGLLAIVEQLDLQLHLSPEFHSLNERFAFASYFSNCILSGAAIGLLVGTVVTAVSLMNRAALRLLGRARRERVAWRLGAAIVVVLVASLLLYLQPQIRGYISGLIIEGQKLPYLYGRLLKYERPLSVLILMGLFIGTWAVWRITRHARSMPAAVFALWLIALVCLTGAAYYIDSHVEVQLYEYTLHRSMFLLAFGLTLSFCGTLYLRRERSRHARRGRSARVVVGCVVVAVIAGTVYTFRQFGTNQNLKVLLLARSIHARQHFKLLQWVLDRDRDGYSPFLGGGDTDDRRSDINPDQLEVIGDGLDNNGIGGELTEADRQEWYRQFTNLHSPSPAIGKRLNVIFIFIDALRADHLGTYGYSRNTSPGIDKLASRSVVFDNALSPSANTFESAARFMKSSYWDADIASWTEVLSQSGYDVLLFPQRRLPMLKRYVKSANVVQSARGADLDTSIDTAIEILRERSGPFCAFIYAVDPHRPYAKHDDFYFGSSNTDLYDGEIAFTDYHFGRLFDSLERSGRMNDTMIVLMADHAESLGERRVFRHSSQLYNDQTHVPMIVYVPGVSPRRVPDYVTTVDLGTTILNVVGVNCPESYAGVSLLSLMRGEPFTHPDLFGEQTLREKEFPNLRPDLHPQPTNKKYMIVSQQGYKLIYDRNLNLHQLYDLKTDPNEIDNLFDRVPAVASEMWRRLGRFIDVVTASRPPNADEAKYKFGEDSGDDQD